MCWLPAGDAKMKDPSACSAGRDCRGLGGGGGGEDSLVQVAQKGAGGSGWSTWGIEVGQELEREELVYQDVLDWPKSLFKFFLNSIQKNLNELFGQPHIHEVFEKHEEKEVTCAWRMRSIRGGFKEEEKGDGVTARSLQAQGMDVRWECALGRIRAWWVHIRVHLEIRLMVGVQWEAGRGSRKEACHEGS